MPGYLLHRQRDPVTLSRRLVLGGPRDPEAVLAGHVVDGGVLVGGAGPVPVRHEVCFLRRPDRVILLLRVVVPVLVAGGAVLHRGVVAAARRAADSADVDHHAGLVEMADLLGQYQVDVLQFRVFRRGGGAGRLGGLTFFANAVTASDAAAGASREKDRDESSDEHPAAAVLAIRTHASPSKVGYPGGA